MRTCVCPNGATVACNTTCTGNLPPLVYVKVTVNGSYSTLFDYPYVSNPITLSRSVEALVP